MLTPEQIKALEEMGFKGVSNYRVRVPQKHRYRKIYSRGFAFLKVLIDNDGHIESSGWVYNDEFEHDLAAIKAMGIGEKR